MAGHRRARAMAATPACECAGGGRGLARGPAGLPRHREFPLPGCAGMTSTWSGRRLLLAAPLLLAAAPLPEEFAALPGQPVLALAIHPAVAALLRPASGGRQRLLSDALRGTGPGVTWEGGWLSGHAHGEGHVFLAFEPRTERLALNLWDGNRPSLMIPPRAAHWPEALRAPLTRFNPEVAALMRWA